MTTTSRQPDPAPASDFQELPRGYHIALSRIIILSVLSYGIYWLYWMYRTWRQYRDHTGEEAYPVCHALTQFVPIYGLFRLHRHANAYRTLMENRGMASNIKMVPIIILALLGGIVAVINISPGVAITGLSHPGLALTLDVSAWVGVGFAVGVMCWIQSNINRYWAEFESGPPPPARFGRGEKIVTILGVLVWILNIAGYAIPPAAG